jgi:protease I
MKQLDHYRVAILVTDGFEEAELIEPLQALIQAGAMVDVVSTHSGEIQGFHHFDKSSRVQVNRTIDSVKAENYDALVLPGGVLNADAMRAELKVLEFVKSIDHAGKPIAAICHAPWILISAGLVKDKIMTGYHTIQDDLKNAGARYVDQQVVVDSTWVTSREPKDIPAFNREMLKLFSKANDSIIHIAESA